MNNENENIISDILYNISDGIDERFSRRLKRIDRAQEIFETVGREEGISSKISGLLGAFSGGLRKGYNKEKTL